MTNTPFAKPFLALAVFCCFCFAVPALAQDKDWRPISPSDLSATASTVEPNADAEALFWEVRVDDSDPAEVALDHYVRVKIFTEKGREDYSKHDIYFLKGTKIKNVKAKVTKPDGTVSYLDDKDVMEREVLKANGIKVRAKSFALPGLDIGSIVEYKYREVIEFGSATMRLAFQREIPIKTISFYVRPFNGNKGLYSIPFNMTGVTFQKDKNSYYRATMNNVPAYNDEPFSPPEDEVKSWMYIYYDFDAVKDTEKYWKVQSEGYYDATKKFIKPNSEVKAITQQVIAGAKNDEEKLRKIFEYVKTHIQNANLMDNPSDDIIKKVQKTDTANEVLEAKVGVRSDVNKVFAAMAEAAGFEARMAMAGDRSDLTLDPKIANRWLMINAYIAAVKVGNDWRFFDPGTYYAPYGVVNWTVEGQQALITDPKEVIWRKVPLSPAEASETKRVGEFKLLDDGTLEGEGTYVYTGHESYYHKRINHGDSASVKEETLKNLLKREISPNIVLTSFSIENDTDPEKPFTYKFKIRIPNYAVRTGKRLFFVPNVFDAATKPIFTATKRQSDVYVSFPWKETEQILIEIPKGFSLESGDAPSPFADQTGIMKYAPVIGLSKDKKFLLYKREFSFGNGGYIRFNPKAYPTLKQMFEIVNKGDLHQLTLRQDDKATAAAQ
jgi:hypothetical protein